MTRPSKRMPRNVSLKDQLFNADTLRRLAEEYAAALPGIGAPALCEEMLAGVPERSLMASLDWFADCLEPHLAGDFPTMAAQLEAAMPAPLDPGRTDDDFGHFIHAVPGVLAVRHGLEDHRERALDLLHAATRRFSMEYAIRAFLNRWPDETLTRLEAWARDDSYHVRRLASEGTRPRLPWGKAVGLAPEQTLPLLDRLHADPTRFVTRSVANHLNDLTRIDPDAVIGRLRDWRSRGEQARAELDWMTRHALRTLVKAGHGGALGLLGYRPDVDLVARLTLPVEPVPIGGVLPVTCTLEAAEGAPVLVDYRIRFARPGGKHAEKVFKLGRARVAARETLALRKEHRLKGDATTFRLHPGDHLVTLQVNGVDRASAGFRLVEP